MKQIISFSVKHPVSVLMIVLAVALVGLFCCMMINADFIPIISERNLLIATEYDGIAAKEMKSMVTVPIEDSFASLKGLKKVTSVTRDGLSLVNIELHWGTDIDMALVECREIIDVCYESLPSRCNKPVVKKKSNIHDTITVALIPLDTDLQYARYIADSDIKPRLQRLKGVSSVSVAGGEKEQIEVIVSYDKMEAKQQSLQSVATVLAEANFEYPAGTIKEGEKEFLVKTSGLYSSVEQIGETPIAYNEGGLVKIADIAETVRGVEDKQTFFLHNGQECLRLGIVKKNDESPLTVSRQVKNELRLLEHLYGTYYRFIILEDLSDQVVSSLISLGLSAIVGVIVTAIIILLFLKSWKIALLLSSVIPLCALATVFILTITGKTLNIMSLSGMAIGIGMVVDAGAVVLENLRKRTVRCVPGEQTEMIINATQEVALSNVGSTITTVVVFIPVFFLNGLLGELFGDMALAIITAILTSCILSISYIPALYGLIASKIEDESSVTPFIGKAESLYKNALQKLFQRKTFAFLPVTVCLIIGGSLFFFVTYELLPRVPGKSATVYVSFPYGTSLPLMQKESYLLYERLKTEPYVSEISIVGGVEQDDYERLSDPAEQKEKLAVSVSFTNLDPHNKTNLFKIFSDLRYTVALRDTQDFLSTVLSIPDESYVVTADTPEDLPFELKSYVTGETRIIPSMNVRELVFVPDRLAGSRFSVSALYVASVARNSLEGVKSSSYYENGHEIPIVVKLAESSIQTVTDLENVNIQIQDAKVPLRFLGSIEEQENEKILYRYNRKDAKIIHPPLSPDMPTGSDENLIPLKKLEMGEMLDNGLLLLVTVILLLYLVMGAQFESFLIPLLLLIALPPAFAGAILFIVVFNQTMNINSIIALVVLFGTAVNNAILLYESCVSVKKVTDESIIYSCERKLRSVMVTSLTTICALVPFAIDPFKQNAQSSLALCVIGGLLFSVILVLFVIPVLFSFTLVKRHE